MPSEVTSDGWKSATGCANPVLDSEAQQLPQSVVADRLVEPLGDPLLGRVGVPAVVGQQLTTSLPMGVTSLAM
jgi:hypothetical protein